MKDDRNRISLDEYLAVCQEHGFERRRDKLQLSAYLHDLGICLHYYIRTTRSCTIPSF